MNDSVLNKVYDLVDEIKTKEEYIRLLELKKIIDQDDLIRILITKFNQAKNKYEEAIKFGKFHPDLKQIQLDLGKAKSELYNNETVSEYKTLEKAIQKMLDDISRRIAQSVSEKIKYPNEIGLINKH